MSVLTFFIFWKIVDLIIAIISPQLIPYRGIFAHPKTLSLFNLPKFLYSFANFDGVYYLLIASRNYQQYEQAFFPLYPLMIRWLSIIIGNKLIAGLLISNISFLLGLIIFKKYLIAIKQWDNKIILFILFFPTSFFFGAVYTEGLFFLLVVLTFYLLKKEKIFLAGICAFFAALSRLVGVFLFIPFLINLFFAKKSFKSIINYLPSVIFPFLGLSLYMYYLYISTGDPLAFFHAQNVFGPGRSTKLILLPQVYFRYLKIFFIAQLNFQYFISLFEFFIFNFVFIILILDLIKIFKSKIKNYSLFSLNLFSLINILLSTLTGSFMSIPRFTLLSLSFFVFLGRIKKGWLIKSLFIVFFILHLITLVLFIQGYFV